MCDTCGSVLLKIKCNSIRSNDMCMNSGLAKPQTVRIQDDKKPYSNDITNYISLDYIVTSSVCHVYFSVRLFAL